MKFHEFAFYSKAQ